ncbi:type II secretion system protein GspD, partial [Thermodesulfobacteriota bacterium]
ERTNCVVTLASEDTTARIREVIRLLDREVPRGKGKIHVYYLQNATAEDVAKVLQNLPSKEARQAKKGEAPVISKDVQISADKATNSLIITAEKHDYVVLEEVIRKLDIPRSMVYIEALIMEVSTDKNFELGVEWRYGNKSPDGAYFAGSGGAGTSGAYQIFPTPSTLGAVDFPTAFSVGVVGDVIRIGDVVFPNIGAVLRAYRSDSDVHILSTPQVLTTNNEEAEITVGKNVPYVTRQETSSASVDYTTYEYKDVGVTLKITPQISQERLVRLQVFQKVERLIQTATADVDRPTTFKRSTQTTVVVKDGHTVVLGGLIDESIEESTYKVPCLGDIPVAGWAFKSFGEKTGKTNLFIFLTPHIIESPTEAEALYDAKEKEAREVPENGIKLYERNPNAPPLREETIPAD